MTFVKAERLPGEPIIITTYRGFVTVEDVRQSTRATVRLAAKIQGHVYAIRDVRNSTSSFTEVLNIVREQAVKDDGTITDPNLSVVLVGTSAMAKLFIDAIHQI